MTLRIHHAPLSRSVRVLWLCEELELPYEIVPATLGHQGKVPAEYFATHPLGKVPALEDGPVVMFESIAIMEYISARYNPRLTRSVTDADFAAYLQWLHFGEASLGGYVTMALGHRVLLPEAHRIEAMAKWGDRETRKCLEALAVPLATQEYLLPSGFSAADISVGYMLLLAKFARVFDSSVPAPVQAYWDRISARPAWKKVSGRG